MDRTPLIDLQTFEIIDEVRGMIAAADQTDKKLDSHDISYMHGLLKAVIMHNSAPAAREDAGAPGMGIMDRAKRTAGKLGL